VAVVVSIAALDDFMVAYEACDCFL